MSTACPCRAPPAAQPCHHCTTCLACSRCPPPALLQHQANSKVQRHRLPHTLAPPANRCPAGAARRQGFRFVAVQTPNGPQIIAIPPGVKLPGMGEGDDDDEGGGGMFMDGACCSHVLALLPAASTPASWLYCQWALEAPRGVAAVRRRPDHCCCTIWLAGDEDGMVIEEGDEEGEYEEEEEVGYP